MDGFRRWSELTHTGNNVSSTLGALSKGWGQRTQPLFTRPDYLVNQWNTNFQRTQLTSCGGVSPASFTFMRYLDKMILRCNSFALESIEFVNTSMNPFFDQYSSHACLDSSNTWSASRLTSCSDKPNEIVRENFPSGGLEYGVTRYRCAIGSTRLMLNKLLVIVVTKIAASSWCSTTAFDIEALRAVVWLDGMSNRPTNGALNLAVPSHHGKSRKMPNRLSLTSVESRCIAMVSLESAELTLIVAVVPWKENVLVIMPLHRSSVCVVLSRSLSITLRIIPALSMKVKPILPRFTRLGFDINHCSIGLPPPKSYWTGRPWFGQLTPLYSSMSSSVTPAGRLSFFQPQDESVLKGRNVWSPVMSPPKAKFPLPIWSGVDGLEEVRIGLYFVTSAWRLILSWDFARPFEIDRQVKKLTMRLWNLIYSCRGTPGCLQCLLRNTYVWKDLEKLKTSTSVTARMVLHEFLCSSHDKLFYLRLRMASSLSAYNSTRTLSYDPSLPCQHLLTRNERSTATGSCPGTTLSHEDIPIFVLGQTTWVNGLSGGHGIGQHTMRL